jgi:hypothetical protein
LQSSRAHLGLYLPGASDTHRVNRILGGFFDNAADHHRLRRAMKDQRTVALSRQ